MSDDNNNKAPIIVPRQISSNALTSGSHNSVLGHGQIARQEARRQKIMSPLAAIKWAIQIIEGDDDENDQNSAAAAFLLAWNDGSVMNGPEWFEYRYNATGDNDEGGDQS